MMGAMILFFAAGFVLSIGVLYLAYVPPVRSRPEDFQITSLKERFARGEISQLELENGIEKALTSPFKLVAPPKPADSKQSVLPAHVTRDYLPPKPRIVLVGGPCDGQLVDEQDNFGLYEVAVPQRAQVYGSSDTIEIPSHEIAVYRQIRKANRFAEFQGTR